MEAVHWAGMGEVPDGNPVPGTRMGPSDTACAVKFSHVRFLIPHMLPERGAWVFSISLKEGKKKTN